LEIKKVVLLDSELQDPPSLGHKLKVLMRKPEGKRRLGRPRRRWEDGIRMDIGETGLGVWIGFE
jgi:hypothetical protein